MKDNPKLLNFLATPEGQQSCKDEDVMKKQVIMITKLEGNGYIKSFKKGGPVKMAMGGDPLTNINQQQFSPILPLKDKTFLKKQWTLVILQAFNPTIFLKVSGKVDG